MNRSRAILIGALLILPIALLLVAGTYALWEIGWLSLLGWGLPIGWGIAYLLLRYRPQAAVAPTWADGIRPPQWTPRDREIYEKVRQDQRARVEVPVSQLSDPHFYLQSAIELSTSVAQYYHPKSSDPVSSLTVVEVLAAAQLAVEDTLSWFHANVPGSHLLTIRHWRALSDAPRWLRLASDATWLISVLWNPLNLPRWLASRYATSSATEEVEASLLTAFHQTFLHNVLLHCIEMNSGRLRGGVARYRAAMADLRTSPAIREPGSRPWPTSVASSAGDRDQEVDSRPAALADGRPATAPAAVRIAIVGQVNAGKSSLINAIRGEHSARCDVLAATDAVDRYRFTVPGTGEQLELLDTPGYGSAELTHGQRSAIQSAWSQADLVLLAMDVTSPARQADWRLLNAIETWYAARPRLKPPPAIGVLTHIDLLSPQLEWQPPYDWQRPSRPKEHNISAAVAYAKQVLGNSLAAVIPVCSDSTNARQQGVAEWLLPAVLASLTEAKATLVVRALNEGTDAVRLQQLVRQFRGAGATLLKVLIEPRSNSAT